MSIREQLSDTHRRSIANIADICARRGIRDIIVSPGSRSAPLTVAFARHPHLRCRVVFDERAAAYIALGLAQQTGRPTGLVCTSGTAAVNYGPAVTEAFYQNVPLLVFTADRPPEWIDQQDNQSIHQPGMFEPHVRGSFNLPEDTNHPDARWHLERIVSEAISRCLWPLPGPVHVNVPLREPLYPSQPEIAMHASDAKVIEEVTGTPHLPETAWQSILATWTQARRKLVVVGMHPPSGDLAAALQQLEADPTVAVVADITANLYPDATPLHHSDMILGIQDEDALEKLAPDLVVTCGGQLVSKSLKLFLRAHRPEIHWHVQPAGAVADTMQSLTHSLRTTPGGFFAELAKRTQGTGGVPEGQDRGYRSVWKTLEDKARRNLIDFIDGAPFGEFAAVYKVMQALPAGSRLQLGNSMAVRYANLIGHVSGAGPYRVNSNRGTSGIDGVVSTAVGAALATDEITTLITGDLAFFYDRNGLWHDHVPANLRIVILNNHGGGIFKMIPGPSQLEPAETERYFVTPQPLTAERTAADHGCEYWRCDSADELASALSTFFLPGDRARILEVETDMQVNTDVYHDFKALCQRLAGADDSSQQ